MKLLKQLLVLLLMIIPLRSPAQSKSTHGRKRHHHKSKNHTKPTTDEQKKAGIKRTLKEKNFHLPDTSSHRK